MILPEESINIFDIEEFPIEGDEVVYKGELYEILHDYSDWEFPCVSFILVRDNKHYWYGNSPYEWTFEEVTPYQKTLTRYKRANGIDV